MEDTLIRSLLILKNINQGPDVRQNLNEENVILLKRHLRFSYHPHTSRRPSNNDSARLQRRALAQKADYLWHIEDQIVRAGFLQHLAVLQATDIELMRIRDE